MAVTSHSDISSLVAEIYENARFVARHQTLMANLVDIRNATGWMDRNVPQRQQVSAVSVGDTEDYNNPTSFGKTSLATITPGEVIAQVTLTDRNLETDPDGAQTDAELELGNAVAEKVDTDLVGLFSSFSTDKGDGAGNTATFANFAAAVAVLDNNKARQFGPINAVLHPYHWHDIWTELGTPGTDNIAGEVMSEALRNYYVDRLLNVDIYTSGNISVDASDDAVSGVFGARSIMLDVRRPFRLEEERDASARAWELNATMGYGYGIVHDGEGAGFKADATEPS